MSKISNVLTFMQYLSTGKKYSIQELSEKLEVSPRMIRVYKDELEKALHKELYGRVGLMYGA